MAFSSAYLIFCRGSAKSTQAGIRYLIIQIISGLMLLAGSVMHYGETGSLEFTHMGLSGMASLLIFLAFWHQVRIPAASQLAYGRLSRIHTRRKQFS